MPLQSEAALENGLIATLQQMSYEYVQIDEEKTCIPISRDSLKSTIKRDWRILDALPLQRQSLKRF